MFKKLLLIAFALIVDNNMGQNAFFETLSDWISSFHLMNPSWWDRTLWCTGFMETTLSLLNLKLIWNLLFLLQLQENLDELQLTPLAGKGAGMWLSAVINYFFFCTLFQFGLSSAKHKSWWWGCRWASKI